MICRVTLMGLVLVTAAAISCWSMAGPPPLSLDGLLDETLSDHVAVDDDKTKADNSACYVCHGNYDGEEMVAQHATESVGCIDCHGPSEAHRNDEDNITPPDVMYPRTAIEKACKQCHDTHDAPAEKVVALYLDRAKGISDPKELVCTDCHGQHRLPFRTVEWDKATRQLLKK